MDEFKSIIGAPIGKSMPPSFDMGLGSNFARTMPNNRSPLIGMAQTPSPQQPAAPLYAAPQPSPRDQEADYRSDASWGDRKAAIGQLGTLAGGIQGRANPYGQEAVSRALRASHTQQAIQAAAGQRRLQSNLLAQGVAGTGGSAAAQAAYQGQYAAGVNDTNARIAESYLDKSTNWQNQQDNALNGIYTAQANLAGQDITLPYEARSRSIANDTDKIQLDEARAVAPYVRERTRLSLQQLQQQIDAAESQGMWDVAAELGKVAANVARSGGFKWIGGAIGSVIPGIGTAVGAGLGAGLDLGIGVLDGTASLANATGYNATPERSTTYDQKKRKAGLQ